MHAELKMFIHSHPVDSSETASWRGDQIQLTINAHFTSDPPPDDLVTSTRAIVLAEDHILMMTNPSGEHILPGGRRESGEDCLSALRREVLEETGIVVEEVNQIAVQHYHHETPEPEIYPYPYPDFLNVIYLVRLDQIPDVSVSDTYEMSGEFIPIDEIVPERLSRNQEMLLHRLSTDLEAIRK